MGFKIFASFMFIYLSGVLIQSIVKRRAQVYMSSFVHRDQNPFEYWFTVATQGFGAFCGLIMVLWAFLVPR